MAEPASSGSDSRIAAAAYLGGFLTATLIAAAVIVFLGHRIGFSTIWERTGIALTDMVLDMPEELIDELAAMDAVIGNAGNPTGAKEHDTIIVRPDAERGWVLRSGVSVDAYQLRAGDPVNLDPPVVYTKAGAEMSDALRSYLERNTLVRFTYNIDADGFRRTVPEVRAERRILMVGDSGLFGVGVDDEDTIASQLQRLVGGSTRVVNAGVAGYDGSQAFEVARALSARDEYAVLVYVAHNNDFYEPRHISNVEKARGVLQQFESLSEHFSGGIHVALITYLEYNAESLLGSSGWREERIRSLDRLRDELPRMTAAAGFSFVDWSDLVAEVAAREETSFAPWSLYVDHAHLAPRGVRLMAERIYAALRKSSAAASQRR